MKEFAPAEIYEVGVKYVYRSLVATKVDSYFWILFPADSDEGKRMLAALNASKQSNPADGENPVGCPHWWTILSGKDGTCLKP